MSSTLERSAEFPDGAGWQVSVTEGPDWMEPARPLVAPAGRCVAALPAVIGPGIFWLATADDLGAAGRLLALPFFAYLAYLLLLVAWGRRCVRLTPAGVELAVERIPGMPADRIAWGQVQGLEQLRYRRPRVWHDRTAIGLRLHGGDFVDLFGRVRYEEREAQRALEWLWRQIERVMQSGASQMPALDRRARIRRRLRSPLVLVTFGFFAYLIALLLLLAWWEWSQGL